MGGLTMAAYKFMVGRKPHIVVKNTAGKWSVLDWQRNLLSSGFKTRKEAMQSTIRKVSE
jgi:hypothetical protein